MTGLGYPEYILTILGFWKLMAVIAILIPRFPRLKEWAYAGFFFELSGAAASHILNGDSLALAAQPLVFLALVMASWALRPRSRKLVS
ncbi:DoxX family protein [Paenibacillus sp. 2RAB27]|uniref:DoxX family protein n=1 Tax=Paenibacillus sp. 2RAB27 TaxID=3232991 RepID=UPI003F9DBAFE